MLGGTRPLTAGKEVYPGIGNTSLIDVSLASSIARLYDFDGFRVVREVFSGRTDLKVLFGCIAHNLMHYPRLNVGSQLSWSIGAAHFPQAKE